MCPVNFKAEKRILTSSEVFREYVLSHTDACLSSTNLAFTTSRTARGETALCVCLSPLVLGIPWPASTTLYRARLRHSLVGRRAVGLTALCMHAAFPGSRSTSRSQPVLRSPSDLTAGARSVGGTALCACASPHSHAVAPSFAGVGWKDRWCSDGCVSRHSRPSLVTAVLVLAALRVSPVEEQKFQSFTHPCPRPL